jgi:hypothetical protein
MVCLDIRGIQSGFVLWLRRTDGCNPIGSPKRRVDDVRLDRPPTSDAAFFLAASASAAAAPAVAAADFLVAAISLALVDPVKKSTGGGTQQTVQSTTCNLSGSSRNSDPRLSSERLFSDVDDGDILDAPDLVGSGCCSI